MRNDLYDIAICLCFGLAIGVCVAWAVHISFERQKAIEEVTESRVMNEWNR